MKIQSLLIFLLLACCTHSIAQPDDLKITWGDQQAYPKGFQSGPYFLDFDFRFVESGSFGHIAILANPRRQPMSIALQNFDQNMQLQAEAIFPLGTKKEKASYQNAMLLGEKLYVFFYRGKEQKVLFAQAFDPRRLTTLGNPVQLMELAQNDQSGQVRALQITPSEDKKHVLLADMVVMSVPGKAKAKDQKANLILLDEKLAAVWKNELTLPYSPEGGQQIPYFSIKDQNQVSLVTSEVSLDNWESKYASLRYANLRLTQLGEGGKQLDTYAFDLGDKVIAGLYVDFRPDQSLVVAGHYSENSGSEAKGIFYSAWEVDKKAFSAPRLNPFSATALAAMVGERRSKRAKEVRGVLLGSMVLGQDESVYLVSEVSFPTSGSSSNPSLNFNKYNDLIVHKLEGDGSLSWEKVITKRQSFNYEGEYYKSFYLFRTEGKIHFLFNDMNLDEYEDAPPKAYKGSFPNVVLAKVSMDAAGNMEREAVIVHPKKEDKVMVPLFCKAVSGTEMIYFGGTGTHFYPALFTWE